MKRVERTNVSGATRDHLKALQDKVDTVAVKEQKKKATDLWNSKAGSKAGKKCFDEIKKKLGRMSNGSDRCMYCEDSAAWHIEHIKPKASYPGQAFRWENYLWACSICNSRYKREKYTEGFLNPTEDTYDLWERLGFDPKTGHYYSLSAEDLGAGATLSILGFEERQDLAHRRKKYVAKVIRELRTYAKLRAKGRQTEAVDVARDLTSSFAAVVEWVLTQGTKVDVPDLGDVEKVKRHFPEVVVDVLG